VPKDTYVIVEAGAKLPADVNALPPSPPIVNVVVPGVVPLAITNPVFLDANANGVFDPPGLPVLAAAARPEEVPGEMTGVTRAQKAAAAKRGEYFPLYHFALPPEAVAMARAAEDARRRAVESRPRP